MPGTCLTRVAIAEQSDELCQKAELYRLKGDLALGTGSQNGNAEEHFRRAIGTSSNKQVGAMKRGRCSQTHIAGTPKVSTPLT
jgi:hypothetical protein